MPRPIEETYKRFSTALCRAMSSNSARDVGLLDAGLPPVAAIPTLSVSGRVLLALLTWLSMLWANRKIKRGFRNHVR